MPPPLGEGDRAAVCAAGHALAEGALFDTSPLSRLRRQLPQGGAMYNKRGGQPLFHVKHWAKENRRPDREAGVRIAALRLQ